MVSTRQMSNVGHVEGSGGNEHGGGGSGCGRVTRHSAPTGGSSPHHQHSSNQHPGHPTSNHQPSTSKSTALALPSRVFTTNLLDLPVEVLEKIFHILGYKSVSQLRMVNRQFNTICSSILNSSFQKLQNQMLQRFHSIKSKMPRRESARRSHPLACESDIIETLHMRLSLLQMTFGKHIERKHCCFFPGEILDEVYSILSYLNTTVKLARPYKVTDELFDLTTMAMEYFKEHIEPNLPEITYFGSDFFDITNTFSPGESSKSYICVDSPPPGGHGLGGGGGRPDDRRPSSLNYLMEESLPPSPPPPQSNMVLRKRIHRIKQGMKKYNDQLESLRSDLRSCKRKTALQQRQIAEQQKQLAEQQKQTVEYATRLDDYDKKNEETSRKFQTLLQELNKCKTELQYWRSRSPAVPPVCAECGLAVMPPLQPMQEVANAINEAEASHSAANNEVEAVVKTATFAAGLGAAVGGAGASGAEAGRGEGPAEEGPSGPSAGASTPLASRRRPSADAGHPHDRKKRRLTRPRKICVSSPHSPVVSPSLSPQYPSSF